MDFGESFKETVKREFKEDAGFEVMPVKLLAILDHDFSMTNIDKCGSF